MAEMAFYNKKQFFYFQLLFFSVCLIFVESLRVAKDSGLFLNRVRRFSNLDSISSVNEEETSSDIRIRSRRSTLGLHDSIACIRIGAKFEEQQTLGGQTFKDNFEKEVTLPEDSKYSLQLAWTGQDFEKIILITSEGGNSSVYLSEGKNQTFVDISHRVEGDITSGIDLTLLKHGNDSQTVYLVANEIFEETSTLHVSTDSSQTFHSVPLPFKLQSNFIYHSKNPNFILALEEISKLLYLSQDKGYTWKKIKTNVIHAKWSTSCQADDIYVITNNDSPNYFYSIFPDTDPKNNVLEKSADLGQSWSNIYEQEHVYTFGMEDKFLYASVYTNSKSSNERVLMVSTDDAKTWNRVRLPTITPERFFSILDSSEGQIFLHVDHPGDTGRGTLYTSDATGIIFSESLRDHLYPNYEDLTDFYRVQSMRGVYIASQLAGDDSVHTMITFDRGGEWQQVKRPDGVECKDETKGCYLQIHNLYSIKRGIHADPPMSIPNAVGIILVHGHVADALQTTEPDVFVSSDGGYNWRLALTGPHHYQIADHGGLLVAVPSDTDTPNVVKFSTDEGGCWISYNFTTKKIVFTGLLIEPGNRDTTVAIWGYSQTDRIWHTFFFNFTHVIDKKCGDEDYENWVAHSHNNDGCLLGSKETFRKMKADSWCYNGKVYEITKTSESCPCTADDYDCDYGYVRSSEKCVKDTTVDQKEIDICLRGHEEKIVPEGYHKIPGDKCQGGFLPSEVKVVNLTRVCSEDFVADELQPSTVEKMKEKEAFGHTRTKAILIGLIAFMALLTITVLVTFLAKKYKILNKKISYRYSSIRCEEDGDSGIESLQKGRSTSLYEDSSDEEVPATLPKTSKLANGHAAKSNGHIPVQQTDRAFSNDVKFDSDVELLE